VTIDGFKGWPRIVNGTQPMIEVNAQRTRLIGIGGMYDPGRGTFGTWVKVNDDEAFLVELRRRRVRLHRYSGCAFSLHRWVDLGWDRSEMGSED
jgi:hypothetical protein